MILEIISNRCPIFSFSLLISLFHLFIFFISDIYFANRNKQINHTKLQISLLEKCEFAGSLQKTNTLFYHQTSLTINFNREIDKQN